MAGSARIDELKKKFDENPGRYFAPLANEYRKAGEIEQAITICRTYLAEKPGHMSGLIVFGQALFEAKKHDEARTTFEQALALDPENLIALRHLGDIARDIGDPGAARGWYQRVLDADPRNEEIAAQLAAVSAEAASAPAAPPAAAESGGMSGWGDINPEQPSSEVASASAASTLILEPVKPPAPADSLFVDTEAPRQSLQLLSMDTAAGTSDIEREAPSLDFEPTSFAPASPSGGGSLGIERTQEFEIPGSGLGKRGGEIELDRPFEAPTDLPSAPSSDLGLEISEFSPPPPEEAPTFRKPRFSLAFGALVVPEEPTETPADSLASGSGLTQEQPQQASTPREASPEPEAEVEAIHAEPAKPAAGFVTETMAELYLKQGYRAEAVNVYRQLVEQSPGDQRLRDKLQDAEQGDARETADVATSGKPTPAPPVPATDSLRAPTPSSRSARAFFGALGTRRAPQRASDPYVSTFEATTPGASSEAGVTGPSDWIMESAASGSGTSSGGVADRSAPEVAPDAFGGSEEAWPDVAPAEPVGAPSPSGGWGIAPVMEPAPAAPVAADRDESAYAPRTPTPPRSATPARSMTPASMKSFAPMTTPPEASTAPEAATLEASAPEAGSLDSFFAGASVKSADNAAAEMLAGAFGAPAATDARPPQSAVPSQRGQPTRAASNELSLDHVFRDSPRKSGAVRQTGGFSFDQFFADDAATNPPVEKGTPAGGLTPAAGTARSDDEVGQFTSWLQGLKKK